MLISDTNFDLFTPKASRRVDDLFEDLRDGHNLLSLLEVLSGEHLVSDPEYLCLDIIINYY